MFSGVMFDQVHPESYLNSLKNSLNVAKIIEVLYHILLLCESLSLPLCYILVWLNVICREGN